MPTQAVSYDRALDASYRMSKPHVKSSHVERFTGTSCHGTTTRKLSPRHIASYRMPSQAVSYDRALDASYRMSKPHVKPSHVERFTGTS